MEVVRTERMVLSRVRPEDLEAVHEIHSDPRTNVHSSAGPTVDMEASLVMLDLWLADWAERGIGYWAARLPERPQVLGIGGLRYAPLEGEDVLHLYYRFRPTAWGHGYATELARAALRVGRGLGTVVALIGDGNEPSRRVAEKAGLHRERPIRYGGVPSDLYVA
ncbi:GNAT family N-acetyltransferase [Nonomuraea sp. NPDC052265]|uniref:GNAT family N-acetyltransferase n=1 Tax=Nonomuraea sp. NPDC052265 TaxID=3364374 RepID=UPI0037C8AEB9